MKIIELIDVKKTITHDWHIKENDVLVLRNANHLNTKTGHYLSYCLDTIIGHKICVEKRIA